MNTVLITGSAGFIGTNLAEYYLKNSFNVIGVDNYCTGSKKNTEYLLSEYSRNYNFFEFDVTHDWPTNFNNIENLKYVFHLASPASVKSFQKKPIETMMSNSIGLKNAIQFSDKKNARLIFSSTSEIYGSPQQSPQREDYWGNVNSYGERSCYDESKRFGEALIFSSNKINSTMHGVVRIFNTYGPRMDASDDRAPNTFIVNALTEKTLTVYGDGKQTRSFCYIDDLITGLTSYAQSNQVQPINLGNSHEINILDLANLVLTITESKSKIDFKELPVDDPPQRKPDLSLALKHLNYKPSVSLPDGLKKTIDWFQSTSTNGKK